MNVPAQQITAQTSDESHWRDASRTARFFIMDATASFPLLLFILHIRMWTFLTALGFMCFFMILERFNFTIPVFFRWLRGFIAGPDRIARAYWRR